MQKKWFARMNNQRTHRVEVPPPSYERGNFKLVITKYPTQLPPLVG